KPTSNGLQGRTNADDLATQGARRRDRGRPGREGGLMSANPSPGSPFAAWGRFVHRRRLTVLVLSLAVLAASGALILAGGSPSLSLQANGQARQAADLVHAQVPQRGASSFQVVFEDASANAATPGFQSAVAEALGPLRSDRRVSAIVTPYDAQATSSE